MSDLLNWPPSRGPEPYWMRQGPELIVPGVKLITVQRPAGDPDPERELVEAAAKGDVELSEPPSEAEIDVERRQRDDRQSLELTLWHRVEAVRELDLKTAFGLVHGVDDEGMFESQLPVRPYGVTLNYPLSVDVAFTVEPLELKSSRPGRTWTRHEQSVAYVLWVVARVYGEIYKEWEHYGVWGHALSELWFEGLEVDGDVLTVHMGS